MDYIILSNGRVVKYTFDLTYDGIIATVQTEHLTSDEKNEFARKLRSERDVVKIYNNA